ncbi:MAG: M20/M25/M40 family metallo-hydrolase [bacterium]
MNRMIIAAVAAVVFNAAAFPLPGELVVISGKEVRPDEAAGLYYLGSYGAGYLYNGSSATLGRVAPYRVLDRGARRKDYYVVWLPEGAAVTAASFGHVGDAVRLSDNEILVGLADGMGAGALRAAAPGVELAKLEAVTPADWRYDGERPPAKKGRRVAAAVATITAESYGGHIKTLQNFKSRFTDSFGYDGARIYVFNFLGMHNLEASYFPFEFGNFTRVYYPDAGGAMYVDTTYQIIKKSADHGATWRTIGAAGIDDVAGAFWLDGLTGFVAGYNGILSRTTDGGHTWSTGRIGSAPSLTYKAAAIGFATAEVGWVGGTSYKKGLPYGEFFVKTIDGGRTWSNQKAPADFRVRRLALADARHGWAGGPNGIVYTADGGSSWRKCDTPSSLGDFVAAAPRTAWGTDDYGRVYKTTDGVNWRRVDVGVAGAYWRIAFADAAHGFAIGDKFVRTVDGGSSWQELAKPPIAGCNIFSFADEGHGVVGYSFGQQLYRTDDGGKSFVDISANIDLSAENVIGERRGLEKPDEIVIIGGHLDCVSEFPLTDAPGAEDNASGVATALAAAAALRNLSFKRTVRFVAFGGEESGLFGSRAYAEYCARKGEKINAFLNADMVGYDEEYGARDDYGVAYGKYPWLFDYIKRINSLYDTGMICERFEYGGSDHRPFWDRGYAALAAIHGRATTAGGQGYIWYHSTEDTFDKISPDVGARFSRDYAATLAHLAGVAGTFPDPPLPENPVAKFKRPFAVYPNPYSFAASTGGVSFVGIKSPATVEIYDLAGRRVGREEVAVGRDAWVWSPATGDGALAPGVYLYRVEGQEQKKAGKVVIMK